MLPSDRGSCSRTLRTGVPPKGSGRISPSTCSRLSPLTVLRPRVPEAIFDFVREMLSRFSRPRGTTNRSPVIWSISAFEDGVDPDYYGGWVGTRTPLDVPLLSEHQRAADSDAVDKVALPEGPASSLENINQPSPNFPLFDRSGPVGNPRRDAIESRKYHLVCVAVNG